MPNEKIALLGGTGKVGGWVVEELIARNYVATNIRVLARSPEKLKHIKDQITIVKGNAFNVNDITTLLQGTGPVDIIISCIGSTSQDELVVEVCAKNIVLAIMKANLPSMPRIIWLSVIGVNESVQQAQQYPLWGEGQGTTWLPDGSSLFGWVLYNHVIPNIIGQNVWNDVANAERFLRSSAIASQTVIVRPTNNYPASKSPAFSDEWRSEGGADGVDPLECTKETSYQIKNASDPPCNAWIYRRAIAKAICDLIANTEHDGSAISLFQGD